VTFEWIFWEQVQDVEKSIGQICQSTNTGKIDKCFNTLDFSNDKLCLIFKSKMRNIQTELRTQIFSGFWGSRFKM
jgi:hypothetical protein